MSSKKNNKKLINENNNAFFGIDTKTAFAFSNNEEQHIKLKSLIKPLTESEEEEAVELTSEQKKAFLEAVSAFAEIAPSIYRKHSLNQVTENLAELIEAASHLTLTETEDWFDRVTVQRHMKQLGESFKVFEKTANEISTLQQRLESAYEDIGNTLGKYYNINEMMNEEETDYQTHFMQTMKKLKIKSPADLKTPLAKKKFFNYLDKTYVSDEEKEQNKEE